MQAGANITPREVDDMIRLPFLRTWFRTRSAIVLHLSNGTMQVSCRYGTAIFLFDRLVNIVKLSSAYYFYFDFNCLHYSIMLVRIVRIISIKLVQGCVITHFLFRAQVNFFQDHTKIILCPLMGAVTYIDENRDFRTYKLSLIGRHGCSRELASRLRLAESVACSLGPSDDSYKNICT
jgi:hypothetical protein